MLPNYIIGKHHLLSYQKLVLTMWKIPVLEQSLMFHTEAKYVCIQQNNTIVSCLLTYNNDQNVCPYFSSQIKIHFISSTKHFEQNLNRMSEEYQGQEIVNEEFNRFVQNYQEAYFGDNTAAYQIQSSVAKGAYSDTGEELPLGPNFQRLIKCFLRYIECIRSS